MKTCFHCNANHDLTTWPIANASVDDDYVHIDISCRNCGRVDRLSWIVGDHWDRKYRTYLTDFSNYDFSMLLAWLTQREAA